MTVLRTFEGEKRVLDGDTCRWFPGSKCGEYWGTSTTIRQYCDQCPNKPFNKRPETE